MDDTIHCSNPSHLLQTHFSTEAGTVWDRQSDILQGHNASDLASLVCAADWLSACPWDSPQSCAHTVLQSACDTMAKHLMQCSLLSSDRHCLEKLGDGPRSLVSNCAIDHAGLFSAAAILDDAFCPCVESLPSKWTISDASISTHEQQRAWARVLRWLNTSVKAWPASVHVSAFSPNNRDIVRVLKLFVIKGIHHVSVDFRLEEAHMRDVAMEVISQATHATRNIIATKHGYPVAWLRQCTGVAFMADLTVPALGLWHQQIQVQAGRCPRIQFPLDTDRSEASTLAIHFPNMSACNKNLIAATY